MMPLSGTLLRRWFSLGLWSAAESGEAQVSLRALLGMSCTAQLGGLTLLEPASCDRDYDYHSHDAAHGRPASAELCCGSDATSVQNITAARGSGTRPAR
jgi:hypothetical protein